MYSRLFGKEPTCAVPHTDEELVRLALVKKKIGDKKIVCNLTTIPSRFKYIPKIVENLKSHHIFDDIVIHVPKVYQRFKDYTHPEILPEYFHIVDTDYGPGTRIVYGQGDIVVYCDDDTQYSHATSLRLVEKFLETGSCCGTSGFRFEKYFQGDFSKTDGESVQVIEGYGMVVCDPKWIDTLREEFKELHVHTYNDDMIFSTLLEKIHVKKQVFVSHGKDVQLEYGFGKDALHYNNGENTHVMNNKRILKTFRELDKMYFEPLVSYGICVCDEHKELDDLLYALDTAIIHSDEIVILVDTNRVTRKVLDVISKYPYCKVCMEGFSGDFARHKNILTSKCSGRFIFNIDADEIPSSPLIDNIYKLIDYDLVYIPRVNIIPGATSDFLKRHSFTLSKEGFINFPDYQGRFYSRKLEWSGSIHEKITGALKPTQIHPDPNASLWHIKSIQRMDRQNELYQKLASGTHD